MKILLVAPWCRAHRRYRALLSPLIAYRPLTLPTLAALIPPELGATVEVCDEIAADYRRFLKGGYDVVGITVISSESGRAYEIAAAFRDRGAHVVLGGYHMLFNSEEGRAHADTVIVGAGEVSWPKFLNDYAAGTPERRYDCQAVEGTMLALPKTEVLPPRKYLNYPTILANPGCPNRCLFCVIHQMWRGGGRPVERVIEELKARPGPVTVFYDPNFFGDRAYALELMRAMVPLRRRWVGAACIDCAGDGELLHWAQASGCAGLLVGLESMSPEALRGVRKGFNDPEAYRAAVARLQDYGINVNGCFVLGLDSDTEETLLSLPEQVDYLGLNLARFSLMTPVPGSELFHALKAQGRILTEDWSDYTQDQVVFQPQNMTPQRLEEIYRRVWRETYHWSAVLRRTRRARTNSPVERAAALATNVGFKFIGRDL